jgi:hypothetical protein
MYLTIDTLILDGDPLEEVSVQEPSIEEILISNYITIVARFTDKVVRYVRPDDETPMWREIPTEVAKHV